MTTFSKIEAANNLKDLIIDKFDFSGKCSHCRAKGRLYHPLGFSYGANSSKYDLEHYRHCPLNKFAHSNLDEYKSYKNRKSNVV